MKTCLLLNSMLLLFVLSGIGQKLDSTFGDKGVIKISNANNSASFTAIATFSNGNFLATWRIDTPYFEAKYFAGKFLANGILDASFGAEGVVYLGTRDDDAEHNIVFQSDGRILIIEFFPFGEKSYLTRLNIDGSRDTDFGLNGVVPLTNTEKIALQSDGKIVILEPNFGGFPNDETSIKRLNPDGSFDNTFGLNGIVTATNFTYHNLAIDSRDRLFCAGTQSRETDGVKLYDTYDALTCFLPDGTIDSTFGNNGTLFRGEEGYSNTLWYVKADSLDNIIWGGGNAYYPRRMIEILKLKPNGIPDSSFGINGITTYRTKNDFDFVRAMAIAPSGNIMFLAGYFNAFLCSFLSDGQVRGEALLPAIGIPRRIAFQGEDLLVEGKIRKTGNEKGAIVRIITNAPSINATNESTIAFQKPLPISIFPNPASTIMNMTGLDPATIATIKIIDNQGRAISSEKAEKIKSKTIDVSKLKPGIYFIQIMQNNKVNTVKFIKR